MSTEQLLVNSQQHYKKIDEHRSADVARLKETVQDRRAQAGKKKASAGEINKDIRDRLGLKYKEYKRKASKKLSKLFWGGEANEYDLVEEVTCCPFYTR